MTEAVPADFGYPPLPVDPAGPPPPRVSRLAELAVMIGVGVLVGLLGFPLGWLWQRVAPHTPAVREPDGAYLTAPEAEHRIADEGGYVILTVGAGLLVAVLLWILLRRFRGPLLTVGLTLGALACGIITWKFGHNFGYHHARTLIDAPSWTGSTNFVLPVDLRAAKVGLWRGWLPFARGDVLAMPITVLLVCLLAAGFSPYPALRATHRDPLSAPDPAVPVGYAPWSPTGQPGYPPNSAQPGYGPGPGQPGYGPTPGQPSYGPDPGTGQPG
jgi:hypothetical protein